MSFLVTQKTVESVSVTFLSDFIIQFLFEFEKELSEIKLFLNSTARSVSYHFLSQF